MFSLRINQNLIVLSLLHIPSHCNTTQKDDDVCDFYNQHCDVFENNGISELIFLYLLLFESRTTYRVMSKKKTKNFAFLQYT